MRSPRSHHSCSPRSLAGGRLTGLVPLLAFTLPAFTSLGILGGCGAPAPEFGPERRIPADERAIIWEASTTQRLLIEEEPKRWTGDLPAGWEERPADPQRFKDAVWAVPGDDGQTAQCWLTAGVGGGLAGNMQRWYRQFEQPVGNADDLPEIPFAGERGQLLELTGTYSGTPGHAMLLAFRAKGQQVRTLKFVGPEALVKQNREKFLALAGSLRQEAGAPVTSSTSSGSMGAAGENPHAGNPHASNPKNEPADSPFEADVPAAWQATNSGRILHHTFGADGQGEIYVSQLSGELNPMMLGIWRAELGARGDLTQEQFDALPRCELLGEGAIWLDLSGDYSNNMTGKTITNARSLVAVQAVGSTIVFAKMLGPATDVMAEAAAFREFCRSIRRKE